MNVSVKLKNEFLNAFGIYLSLGVKYIMNTNFPLEILSHFGSVKYWSVVISEPFYKQDK